MKKNHIGIALILALFLIPSCRREVATSPSSETIAPATPPQVGTDTDSVSTQTVEIGDERSPNEGGALSEGDGATPAATVTGTPSPSPSARNSQ